MRAIEHHAAEFADFTEENYRRLLRLAKESYFFSGFGDDFGQRPVLWRHDLDASMPRALRLARIEHEEGVLATYFLFPRCLYYNLLNPITHAQVREIIAMGHDIALHFDPTHTFEQGLMSSLEDEIAAEAALLHREFGQAPTAVSFHLYGVLEMPIPGDFRLGGLVNAYADHFRNKFGYVSDSNGIWLHQRLEDVLKAADHECLQVLTHPEWWTAGVYSPRVRLQQAIDDQAAQMSQWYDTTVERSGRPNLR